MKFLSILNQLSKLQAQLKALNNRLNHYQQGIKKVMRQTAYKLIVAIEKLQDLINPLKLAKQIARRRMQIKEHYYNVEISLISSINHRLYWFNIWLTSKEKNGDGEYPRHQHSQILIFDNQVIEQEVFRHYQDYEETSSKVKNLFFDIAYKHNWIDRKHNKTPFKKFKEEKEFLIKIKKEELLNLTIFDQTYQVIAVNIFTEKESGIKFIQFCHERLINLWEALRGKPSINEITLTLPYYIFNRDNNNLTIAPIFTINENKDLVNCLNNWQDISF